MAQEVAVVASAANMKPLVWSSPRVGCGSCGPVLTQIGDWPRRLDDEARIIVATSSSRASIKKSDPSAVRVEPPSRTVENLKAFLKRSTNPALRRAL